MGAVNHGPEVKQAMLAAYRRLGRVDTAAKAVGLDRSAHYRWLKTDADYKRDFEDCADEVAGLCLDEIKARGIDGWDEPVFHAGKRAMDIAHDADGRPLRVKCAACDGRGSSAILTLDGRSVTCSQCAGSGQGAGFVEVPAVIRKKSDACILALAGARVPGFNPKMDHRFVDEKGKDRKLDVDSVTAWIEQQPDSQVADDA